jgi:hypothetical protein
MNVEIGIPAFAVPRHANTLQLPSYMIKHLVNAPYQASFGSVGTVLLGILLAGLFFASGSASLAFLKFDRIVGRMAF